MHAVEAIEAMPRGRPPGAKDKDKSERKQGRWSDETRARLGQPKRQVKARLIAGQGIIGTGSVLCSASSVPQAQPSSSQVSTNEVSSSFSTGGAVSPREAASSGLPAESSLAGAAGS